MKPIENRLVYLSLLLVLALGFQTGPLPPPNSSVEWQSKVDPWVLNRASQGETEFLLLLREQADLSGAAALESKLEKGRFVFERLTEVAERTQPALRRELEASGLRYRSYWIANMIWVRGGLAVVENLARRSDVARLYANPWVRQAEPETSEPIQPDSAQAPTTIEWNLLKINADDVWAAGFTGQGVVVAGQDTGYDWTHPALQEKYRGWNGSSADHNYNWHDAIHSEVPGSSPGNSCGYDSPVPCDDNSHGTHTMGTMVGDDGGTNQIGVAPGAKWIGCRNMDDGWGAPSTYSECYQWFLAPTDLNGLNPRPDQAPDVINNSWSCPPAEGCTDPNVLLTVVNNVRAAGIMTVHSAGNSGPGCETVNTPAAIYDASFTVGNTTSADTISSSSSRGPVSVDGSGRMKPDISAPGTSIRSSIVGGGYASYSGTSMASPHVAGMAALLISAQPQLAGDVDQLEQMIRSSAIPLSNTQTCGGIPAGEVPNNVFGYGRIDALNGILLPLHTMTIQKTASASTIASGGLLTYTLSVSHQHISAPTYNVIVSDTLPLGSEFISAVPGYALDGRTVTWQFPELAAGESQEMELVVRVNEFFSGVLTNDLYAARSDEVPSVFGSPVATTVQGYGLELLKQAPSAIFGGELLTYTLQAHNTHPTLPQHNLVITDRLPITTSFYTATMPYFFDGEIIRWEFPSIDPDSLKEIELVVSLPITATGTIENKSYTAWSDQVTAGVPGPPVFTEIQALPGLEMSTGTFTFARSGDLLAIEHTITNTTAAEIEVELQLDSELDWAQTDLNPFALGPGETKLLTILVNIPLDAAAGTLETLALIARSQSNPLIFARADDYVQVLHIYFFPVIRKIE